MCFSANMSLGMGVVGLAAAGITFADSKETFWVRAARSYAIFHFSLMEFIQYFAYPVADQCGYGDNLLLSQLSTIHIGLQAFAIMPGLATYSSDKTALKKATVIGLMMSSLFIILSQLPKEWQFFFEPVPHFIGNLVSCLFMGTYHIGYHISSAFATLFTHGSLFALAFSGFLWKDNWRISTYHCVMAILTLFMPQWLLGVTTGEAAAIYCFYSVIITGSFMPYFKGFFTAKKLHDPQDLPVRG